MAIGQTASVQRTQRRQLSKLIESIISFIIIILTFIEIIQMRRLLGRFVIGFVISIEILIIFSLSFNIVFAFLHHIYVLLYLQILFANYYFVTFYWFIGYNIAISRYCIKVLFNGTVLLFFLIYSAVFIIRVITQRSGCKQLQFLIVDCVVTLMSFLVFGMFYRHYSQQKQCKALQQLFNVRKQSLEDNLIGHLQSEEKKIAEKMQFVVVSKPLKLIDDEQNLIKQSINNPFPSMWFMIAVNMCCSLITLAETIFFIVKDSCNYVKDDVTEDEVIQLVLNILSYHLGFLATLYCFYRKRKMKIQQQQVKYKHNQFLPSDQYSDTDDGRGKLELIHRQTMSRPSGWTEN